MEQNNEIKKNIPKMVEPKVGPKPSVMPKIPSTKPIIKPEIKKEIKQENIKEVEEENVVDVEEEKIVEENNQPTEQSQNEIVENDNINEQPKVEEEKPKKEKNKEQKQKEEKPKKEKQPKEKKAKEPKEKKEKQPKEKKEKQPKEKKKLSKKQKTIIFVCLAVVLVALIIVAIFILLPKAVQMDKPKIKVYDLSNQTIIHVDENPNCDYYEFYVQKQGSDVMYLKSSSNEAKLTSFISDAPCKYDVWARYGSKDSKLVSETCAKQTFIYYKTIGTPQVSFSQDKTKLFWAPITNATEYRVYYAENEYFTVPVTASNVNVNFDILSNFNEKALTAGSYTLYVQAMANESLYYLSSELSESKEYVYTYKLNPVENALFKKSTGILSFDFDSEKTPVNKFQISIKLSNMSVTREETFVLSDAQAKLNHSFDLTLSIQNYGFSLSDVQSVKIVALGYNEYVQDSNSFSSTIE